MPTRQAGEVLGAEVKGPARRNIENIMPTINPPPGFDHDAVSERYIVLAKIGSGGMGETVRAWDQRDGRLVAIKMPKAALVQNPGFIERFDREARMLQRVVHPSIVPITDIGTLQGLPFFAMPFLPGGSLAIRRLRDDQGKPLPNQAGMLHFWLPEMAAALDYLHAQGIVHRDVKPANIFFDVFWHAYLGDFGLAKIVDEAAGIEREETLTGTNMAMGTELYMAPEMFRPKPALTGAIDQYALAVSVYEILAGRRPFTGEMAHPIVEVTTQAPPPLDRLRSDLPASLVKAVHRGLAKQAQDRFASCEDFCRAALADVRPLESEPGIARLACPKCSNIIRIAVADAGRAGKCSRCRKRLIIAGDFSGLWTRSEQEVVSGHLAGQPVVSQDVETPVNAADDDGLGDFKPLSKSQPVPKKPRPKRAPTLIITGALAGLSLIALGFLVWQLQPRKVWSIDTDSRIVIDDGRLVAFGPKGFRRSSKSDKYLVEYTYRGPGRTPRIRVLSGAAKTGSPSIMELGSRRALVWTQPAQDAPGLGGNGIATYCSVEIGRKPYTVEVVTDASEAIDASQLCTLVARALRAGSKNATDEEWMAPNPREPTGLRVEYFIGRDLQQKIDYPQMIDDSDMHFDWLDGPPVSGLPPDEFSIRWTGIFIPDFTGQHRFVGYRDNGLRIWVNGRVLVDEWNDGWGDFVSSPVRLYAGKNYPIQIEYYEAGGGAGLTLNVRGETGEVKLVERKQLRPKLD
jgi:serine/threonine protein kinase